MLAKKCDRCGCLYENYNKKNDSKNPNGFHLLNIDEFGNSFSHKTIDLCQCCMTAMLDWFNGGTKNDEA